MADQEQETVSQQNPQESQVESLPQQQDIEISEQPQQSGLKSRWIDFKKAYMHAYLNIVSIPLKKDENKESVVDRIYRYSDFPLLTQVFPFFAYRALEKRFYGQFFFCQVGIQYLLQHFNYLHIPSYMYESKEKQMGMELCESACLSAVSTGCAMLMNKFPHNKYYYLLSMLVLGVPSVLGALWSRRKDIREGIPLFDNYLQIQGKSRAAAQKATSEICASRFVLGITQFTLPLLCIRPVERRYNMFFYTFQKNLFFTELCFLCGLFLSSASCAIFMPFGTLKKGTYVDNEGKTVSVDPQESNYFFFKGL